MSLTFLHIIPSKKILVKTNEQIYCFFFYLFILLSIAAFAVNPALQQKLPLQGLDKGLRSKQIYFVRMGGC